MASLPFSMVAPEVLGSATIVVPPNESYNVIDELEDFLQEDVLSIDTPNTAATEKRIIVLFMLLLLFVFLLRKIVNNDCRLVSGYKTCRKKLYTL